MTLPSALRRMSAAFVAAIFFLMMVPAGVLPHFCISAMWFYVSLLQSLTHAAVTVSWVVARTMFGWVLSSLLPGKSALAPQAEASLQGARVQGARAANNKAKPASKQALGSQFIHAFQVIYKASGRVVAEVVEVLKCYMCNHDDGGYSRVQFATQRKAGGTQTPTTDPSWSSVQQSSLPVKAIPSGTGRPAASLTKTGSSLPPTDSQDPSLIPAYLGPSPVGSFSDGHAPRSASSASLQLPFEGSSIGSGSSLSSLCPETPPQEADQVPHNAPGTPRPAPRRMLMLDVAGSPVDGCIVLSPTGISKAKSPSPTAGTHSLCDEHSLCAAANSDPAAGKDASQAHAVAADRAQPQLLTHEVYLLVQRRAGELKAQVAWEAANRKEALAKRAQKAEEAAAKKHAKEQRKGKKGRKAVAMTGVCNPQASASGADTRAARNGKPAVSAAPRARAAQAPVSEAPPAADRVAQLDSLSSATESVTAAHEAAAAAPLSMACPVPSAVSEAATAAPPPTTSEVAPCTTSPAVPEAAVVALPPAATVPAAPARPAAHVLALQQALPQLQLYVGDLMGNGYNLEEAAQRASDLFLQACAAFDWRGGQLPPAFLSEAPPQVLEDGTLAPVTTQSQPPLIEYVCRLGAGCYGQTWIVKVPSLFQDLPVVLKQSPLDRSVQYECFVKEVSAMVTLPLVAGAGDAFLPVLAAGWDLGARVGITLTPYMGEDLSKLFMRSQGMTVAGCHLLEQLCVEVALMHQAGYAHNDIKPHNAFTLDGKVVLGDLGNAQQVDLTTALPFPGGSAEFAAPEVLRLYVNLTSRAFMDTRASDVFSLAATILWCFEGRVYAPEVCDVMWGDGSLVAEEEATGEEEGADEGGWEEAKMVWKTGTQLFAERCVSGVYRPFVPESVPEPVRECLLKCLHSAPESRPSALELMMALQATREQSGHTWSLA